jgi:hypothetical protein
MIWIDDELSGHFREIKNKRFFQTSQFPRTNTGFIDIDQFKNNPKLLLIAPKEFIGHSPNHFSLIDRFIANEMSDQEVIAYNKTLQVVI